MKSSDVELVERAREGDRAAFEALVERYRDAVCGVAYHHLGNFDDVQDAAQEAFVRAYLRLGQLRDPEKFGPWLCKIASNVSVTRLRSRVRTEVELYESDEARFSDSDPHRSAVRIIVRDALAKLSEKTRLTVTLACINGYSHEEIATFLEVPINTVRSRLRIAKNKLREEMIGMVSDSLHEGKPGDELSVGIVDEIVKRAYTAAGAYKVDDALRAYDEALEAIEKMASTMPPEQMKRKFLDRFTEADGVSGQERSLILEDLKKRPSSEIVELWRAEILRHKSSAAYLHTDPKESVKLLEEAFEITERLGFVVKRADVLHELADRHWMAGLRDQAMQYDQMALEEYEKTGDLRGQAERLFWFGCREMRNHLEKNREYIRAALALYEQLDDTAWVIICQVRLKMLDEVGEESVPLLTSYSSTCPCLKQEGSALMLSGEQGQGGGGGHEVPALNIRSLFWQISHLRKFLDASIPVGESWSGDSFSYTTQPLKTVVTVISDSETVTVPAGTFDHCLLTEQVTSESDLPDNDDDHGRGTNRRFLCGTHRAWYAPGAGLVKLHVKMEEDGIEGTIHLKDFAITQPSTDYFPLAIGNSWTYGWADIPEDYVAKEAYRVAANDGDLWYLEAYHYIYQKPKTCPDI